MKKFYATLAMLFVIVASMAQPREIKGVVHDENDKPMSGVTVYVPETGAGTITDSKGNYAIKVPGAKSEVSFSFMGYKTLKMTLGDPKAKFDVVKLTPDNLMFDEVVVVGYGTQKNGHRAVFMAHHAPYMLRIAGLTGDRFLHDIARSAIVGRYANFPGYHMNTARTTAYEKPDFPLHPHDSMSVTSFHYNHPFPLLSVLYDYLVTDASVRSQGAIAFPGDYIEGYGYLQAKFYGNRPGRFYDREGAWLWMPRRLLRTSDVELNYLSARCGDELLIAFTNQSRRTVTSQVELNRELLPMLAGREVRAEVWTDNRRSGETTLTDGRTEVTVSPEGITALMLRGVRIEPRFQERLTEHDARGWAHDYGELDFGRARAMVLNLGRDLKSCYIYLQDDDSRFRHVSMTYSIDGNPPQALNDTSYPYEFTVALPSDARQIVVALSGITTDGRLVRSQPFKLSKN